MLHIPMGQQTNYNSNCGNRDHSRSLLRLKSHLIFLFLLIGSPLLANSQTVLLPIDEIRMPICGMVLKESGKSAPLAPEKSYYSVIVTDGFASLRLTQLYVNNIGAMSDLVYIFPLPDQGSVHAMSMEHLGKIYRAKILERAKAQERYDSIVKSGGQASLLIQERPNVFQQRIANLEIGDSTWIEIDVSLTLKYELGRYELSIPTMVAKRYEGLSSLTNANNPWNPPANRSGAGLQIQVLLQTGWPITNLQSPTHSLSFESLEQGLEQFRTNGTISKESVANAGYGQAVQLKALDTYPNKDFVLRFERNSKDQDFTLSSHFDSNRQRGYFALGLYPSDSLFVGERKDLEVLFLMDISGSQSGWPLQKQKEITTYMIQQLKPTDRFSVVSFNNMMYWVFGTNKVVSATDENKQKAIRFVDGLSTSGGTELFNAIENFLKTPMQSEHQRLFVFLTDGFINNENEIFQLIKNHPTKPQVFTFGAGNSLNRFFLEQSAEISGGFSTPITQFEDVQKTVANAWERIEGAQLKNITVEFPGIENLLVHNGTSLFKGSPLWFYGQYANGGPKEVKVKGYRNGELIEIKKSFQFCELSSLSSILPSLWAKQRIQQLSLLSAGDSYKDSIIAVSVAYQVLSQYTAFLAEKGQVIESPDQSISNKYATTALLAELTKASQIKWDYSGLLIDLPVGTVAKRFRIYDLSGKLIYSLELRHGPNGNISIHWDGMLADGSRLQAGRYLLQIETNVGLLHKILMTN